MDKSEPNKGGRPPHEPTKESRKTVKAMTAYGIKQADVADFLEIDEKTLRKHYRRELDFGEIEANAKVAESLFKKATGDGPHSGTCAIFWAKTRMGWKDTTVHEHTGADGGPIRTEEIPARERIAGKLAGLAARGAAAEDTGGAE